MTPKNYFQALRRHWLIVLLCTLAGLGAALAVGSSMAKSFEASAQLVVNVAGGESASDVAQGADYALKQMPTYVGMANSAVVLDPVIKRLGLDLTSDELAKEISADSPLGTTLIVVTVKDADAKRATDIANAVADALSAVLKDQSPAPGEDKVIAPQITTPATVPGAPASPSSALVAVVGLLLGLVIGWLVAIALWSRVNQAPTSIRRRGGLGD